MAIQFQCPSCGQPIEVDDAWAGQAVGCPYCKKVVTAPSASTWIAPGVPMASPGGGAFTPPPPPAGAPSGTPGTAEFRPASGPRTALAGWGLAFVLLAIVIIMIASLSWASSTVLSIQQELGHQASREELRRALQDMLAKGEMKVSRGAAAGAVAGVICALIGVVLSAAAMARREPRRAMALTAFLVGLLTLTCGGMFALTLLAAAETGP